MIDPHPDKYERDTRECPFCDGDLLEPRSSNRWHCADCARQFHPDELEAER